MLFSFALIALTVTAEMSLLDDVNKKGPTTKGKVTEALKV